MIANNAMINALSTSQKLAGSNYDIRKQKIQYLLSERDLLEHLTIAKFPPSNTNKDGKPIDTSSVQYQESLQAYQDWSNKDQRARFTILYFMYDDLIGEFGHAPWLRTCGTNSKSVLVKHSRQGFVPCSSNRYNTKWIPVKPWLSIYELWVA